MIFATASVSNCGFSFVYRSQRITANTRTVMRGRFAVSGIITAIFGSIEWIFNVCIAGS